ncbi:LysR family transcriptional regulator [Nonomuraea sp. CA-143628]|uniref:LysR family transcriptional regulator n=1 Tax=Nonomuraea sp. CA-143628 TaxID=3239997 RepID=UPI003D8C7536
MHNPSDCSDLGGDIMDVEFRHLRYFMAVAEQGSFNRAAAALLVSQPSLSRQIGHLERHLGQTLFHRTPQGTTLTPEGVALVGHARELLALLSATPEIVAGPTRPRELVSIGVPPGVLDTWLVDTARALHAELPHCEPAYREAGSNEQLRLLRRGSLDIAIVHQAPPADHVCRRLWAEPLGAAVRPSHPLAAQDSYALDDLDGLRVLVHSRDQVPTQQDSLMAAALAADIRPQWLFTHFVQHALACAEAAEADAVVVGSHTAARQLPEWPWRPLAGLSLPMITWAVRPAHTRTVVEQVAAVIAAQAAGLSGADQA